MTATGPARDPEDAVRAVVSALPDVAAAIVFGSRAMGDADARSDLDLALACPGVERAAGWRSRKRSKRPRP